MTSTRLPSRRRERSAPPAIGAVRPFARAAGRLAIWLVMGSAVLAGAGIAADPADDQVSEFAEHLGQFVPADIVLTDENGQPVRLGDFLDKPTILSLVYYNCPGICTPLLTEVADVLGKSSLDPTKQPFQLLTVSFEPTDDHVTAQAKRTNYLKQVGRPLPPQTWRFFTGDAQNLRRLTEAVGFRYKRAGQEYVHPGGLIVLSPDGKIVRYLYGIEFLPFDFQMAVYEAAQGKVTPTTARLLRFCFSYDPEGRTYVFNLARVVGSVMLASVAFFIGFLIFSTRGLRGRKGGAHGRT